MLTTAADRNLFQLTEGANVDRLSDQININRAARSTQILWQHQDSGRVEHWQIAATGQAQVKQPLPRTADEADWQLAGIADFDRDGQMDNLWRHRRTGQTQVRFNRLDSAAKPVTVDIPTIADPLWNVEGIADFNQDGNVDILWRHQALGANQIWLMVGAQRQQVVNLPTIGNRDWKIGGVGDFNQDQQPDLVWRHQTSGQNAMWLMDGTKVGTIVDTMAYVDPNWQITGVADVNQDGQTDLLWRHDTLGENVVWLMQGEKFQGLLGLAPVADRQWQMAAVEPTFVPAAAPIPDIASPIVDQPVRVDWAVESLMVKPMAAPVSSPITPSIVPSTNAALPLIPGESVAVTVQFRSLEPFRPLEPVIAVADRSRERVKLSWYLSNDSSINRSDVFLSASSVAVNIPTGVSGVITQSWQQTLQLPEISSAIWQSLDLSVNANLYLGVVIDAIQFVEDSDRANNQAATAIKITPPLLTEYDFVYRYRANDTASSADSATGNNLTGNNLTIADSYRGTVVDYADRYRLDQVIDPRSELNQGGQNGFYQITGSRIYRGGETIGAVRVTEYTDAESQTRYEPVNAIGATGLGSESGYIQPRQSNRDRFGHDFYEADVWLTPIVAPAVGQVERSTDLIVRSLTNPFLNHWDTSANGGVITYSFYRDTGTRYSGQEIVAPVNAAVQRNVRQMLGNLETLINVRFVEVEETATTAGVIRYLASDGGGESFYAYTYYPGSGIGGDVHLSNQFVNDPSEGFGAAMGSYGYRSLLHETLHALGFKHPGNYDAGSGSSPGPFLPIVADNSTNTIMSYNVAGFHPVTPMAYDLQALQYLYGARPKNENATTYQFTSLSRYQANGETAGLLTQPSKHILWDSGGIDTIDFSTLRIVTNHWIDLRSGGIITAESAYNSQVYFEQTTNQRLYTSDYGVTIAANTLIENFTNSRGNDVVIANQASNQFLGYRLGVGSGSDRIEGGDRTDTLVLQDYQRADIQVRQENRDLVLRLGGDGTVRLSDYFVASASANVSSTGAMGIQFNDGRYRYDTTFGWQRDVDRLKVV
jgi:hypothetical protein